MLQRAVCKLLVDSHLNVPDHNLGQSSNRRTPINAPSNLPQLNLSRGGRHRQDIGIASCKLGIPVVLLPEVDGGGLEDAVVVYFSTSCRGIHSTEPEREIEKESERENKQIFELVVFACVFTYAHTRAHKRVYICGCVYIYIYRDAELCSVRVRWNMCTYDGEVVDSCLPSFLACYCRRSVKQEATPSSALRLATRYLQLLPARCQLPRQTPRPRVGSPGVSMYVECSFP